MNIARCIILLLLTNFYHACIWMVITLSDKLPWCIIGTIGTVLGSMALVTFLGVLISINWNKGIKNGS